MTPLFRPHPFSMHAARKLQDALKLLYVESLAVGHRVPEKDTVKARVYTSNAVLLSIDGLAGSDLSRLASFSLLEREESLLQEEGQVLPNDVVNLEPGVNRPSWMLLLADIGRTVDPAVQVSFFESVIGRRGTTIAPIFERYISGLSGHRGTGAECLYRTEVQLNILDTVPRSPGNDEESILVTSALPYVNNVPHLGNLIGSVLSADCFARYSKAKGRNTLFICGTDEYGTATETKAFEDKTTPQALCDKYHALHREIYDWFDIGFDYFGRTTTPEQTDICQGIFKQLYENGLMEEHSVTQLYCPQHLGFLADRFVEGRCPREGCGYEDARGDQCDKCGHLMDPLDLIEPKCKLDRANPVKKDSKHFFLKLEHLQEEVKKWIDYSSATGEWSKNARVISDNWLREGLRDRCITRDLKWGVPVPNVRPGFEEKVFYVWFDAPIGYVSITANFTENWKSWWQNPENVKLFQFIGKDNVPFHSVVFPACQLGTRLNWTMAHHISTAEYLQYENGKFSKSRGVGVFGNDAKDTGVPVDVWRYYLLASRPETSDTQFLWRDLVSRNNAELLGNLGNLVNRVIKFTTAKYSGFVPFYHTELHERPEFEAFKADISDLIKKYNADMTGVKIRAGIEKVMRISSRCNYFLQENQLGNKLFEDHPDRCCLVIGLSLNCLYLLSALIYPFMPGTSASIIQQLNLPPRKIPDEWSEDVFAGHRIGCPAYLFQSIDESKIGEWQLRYSGKQTEQ
ncbi:methionyl-tRNA synthetase [Ascobolus immersus RN42]|uniref:methionine--tRNA ligase n=1 Tax=Ascobolus immersus RN42 TaxID=1160509 RepID=A0A3N4I8G5_ASCIM|nr:methionyl-tRNA synthetase [Ascobolus immersus RN42]